MMANGDHQRQFLLYYSHTNKGFVFLHIIKYGIYIFVEVRKRAEMRNRYNQAPHLTQYTNGKVTPSQLDITNESQEVSLFPAGDHTA